MPGPAVYVVAVVAGVAAGVAFKEFVYDPHLAPKIEEWTSAYAAYRSERRRKRASPQHSQSHSHSDDKGTDSSHGSDGRSSLELEGLVEREMQTLDRNATLRKRRAPSAKGGHDGNGLEMIEKMQPNTFLPFEPLSPTPAQSSSPQPPNPFLSRSETALPIGRLPTPISDHMPSPSRSVHTAPSLRAMSPLEAAATFVLTPSFPRSPTSPTSSETPSLVSAPASGRGDQGLDFSFPASEFDSRAPSRSSHGDEYDFMHPSVSADGSRATTPFTDAHSESSFTDTRSESVASLDDFLGSDADSDAEFLRAPSPVRGQLAMSEAGSEDWEHVNEAGGR